MLKTVTTLAATALLVAAMPAFAQDAEEPRTTYRIVMLDLADGKDARWNEMFETYAKPARAAAGLAPETVHWLMMNPDYDIMIVSEVPRGMATFDSHANPERERFMGEIQNIAGGEAAMATLMEEYGSLIEKETVMWTHTHP